MRNVILWVGLAVTAGCTSEPGDVVGPFTGEVHRFVVDEIRIPMVQADVTALGEDLDGDGLVDNQLGQVTASLAVEHNVSRHAADMIRAGAIASLVEIQADDLQDDDAVGVRYLGADGAEATVVGGRLLGGDFVSNRTARTEVLGEARVHLPVFTDADPLMLPMRALQLELRPDGGGGYTARLQGAFFPDELLGPVHAGLVQLLAANPPAHRTFLELLEGHPAGTRDGLVTLQEVEGSMLVQSLLAPDVGLRAFPQRVLSFGFEVHLSPCAEGRCAPAAPAPTCHDRVRNGSETDVDCGGGCPLACAGDLACAGPADCQSGTCDAGTCDAPSCADGRSNGFETGIDCGGVCAPCGP